MCFVCDTPLDPEQLSPPMRAAWELVQTHKEHPMGGLLSQYGFVGANVEDLSLDGIEAPIFGFQFCEDDLTAYVWERRGWRLSPWHPYTVRRGRTVEPAGSFLDALNRLDELLPAARFRPSFRSASALRRLGARVWKALREREQRDAEKLRRPNQPGEP